VEKLKKELDSLINRLQNSKSFRAVLEGLVSVYPFSEYEYIISHLFAADKLTLEEYYELRNSYIKRNLYLSLFEISAPRGFGDKWALGHLLQIVPEFKMASKKLDKNYSNDYDLWLDLPDKTNGCNGIRIEVKASRAVDFKKPDEPLYIKALSGDSKRPFDMNFQQIKPRCTDVFIWVAVWRDIIKYWVLNTKELQGNRHFSKGQHRGNIGEGQLHLNRENIFEFDKYEVKPSQLKQAVIKAYKRLKND
jgi:hypothetical protein